MWESFPIPFLRVGKTMDWTEWSTCGVVAKEIQKTTQQGFGFIDEIFGESRSEADSNTHPKLPSSIAQNWYWNETFLQSVKQLIQLRWKRPLLRMTMIFPRSCKNLFRHSRAVQPDLKPRTLLFKLYAATGIRSLTLDKLYGALQVNRLSRLLEISQLNTKSNEVSFTECSCIFEVLLFG
jgi:hypothetical protein